MRLPTSVMGFLLPLLFLTISSLFLQASGLSLPSRRLPGDMVEIDDEVSKDAMLIDAEDKLSIPPTKTIDTQAVATVTITPATNPCDSSIWDFVRCVTEQLGSIRYQLPGVTWDDTLSAEAKTAAERCDNDTVSGDGLHGANSHDFVNGVEFRERAWTIVTMMKWQQERLRPSHPNFDAITQKDVKIAGCAWSEGCYPDYYLKCILSEASSGDQAAQRIERRDGLFTGEYFPPKISGLRQRYGVDGVERERQLELLAYESVRGCNTDRTGSEMRIMVGGGNWTEETGAAMAWEKWQAEIGNPDFGQRFDVWTATRPHWKWVGCAWSGFCDKINGRILSCKFWDANNKDSLGPPEI